MNWGICRARARDTPTHAETRNGLVLVMLGDLNRAVDDWLDEEIIGLEPEEG